MITSPLVLITGINGFVGQHMAGYLLSQGIQILGIGRQNACELKHDLLSYKRCDITNLTDLQHLLKHTQVDYIVHLAGANDVKWSFQHPDLVMHNNAIGTLRLLEAARTELGGYLKGFLAIGTGYEYRIKSTRLSETSSLAPTSPYGWSKLCMTSIVQMYAQIYQTPTLIARTFNLIGPGNSTGVCADFAKQVVRIERGLIAPLLMIGDQCVKRDFLDVRDAVAAYWSLLQIPDFYPGSIYNVCSAKAEPISKLVQLLKRYSHLPFEVTVKENLLRLGESNVIRGDNSKLLKSTSWKPSIPLAQSIRDTLDYYRIQKN